MIVNAKRTTLAFLKAVINNLPSRIVCMLEHRRQTQSRGLSNERSVEWSFVFRHLTRCQPHTILDVGSGTTALPYMMSNCGFSVDAIDGDWLSCLGNRHFFVTHDDIVSPYIIGRYDLITCISVLEHIEQSAMAIMNMFTLLNDYGFIILSFPYSEHCYIENVYRLSDSNAYGNRVPYICQSFSRNHLNLWLEHNGGIILDQEYWLFWEGVFWTEGKRVIPPREVSSEERHQLSCVLIQKVRKG